MSLAFASAIAALPVWNDDRFDGDWLVQRCGVKSEVSRSADGKELVLSNGLAARRFRIGPNIATVGLEHLPARMEFVRATRPEAVVTVDGKDVPIGGLTDQPNRAFLLPEWLDGLKAEPAALPFLRFEVGPTEARFAWKRVRHSANLPWPPPGKRLTLVFGNQELEAQVHYELYDGIPLFAKWFTLVNRTQKPMRVNRFVAETLAAVEGESIVDDAPAFRYPNLTLLTDYAFGGMAANNSNRTVYWNPDPEFKTQVNYNLKTPCLLEVRPPLGPDVDLMPGASFESFRVFELLQDSTERERQGLAVRRMYRTLAPWCTENPIMLHLTSTDPKVVHPAIDQAAECGFEMIVISFWSGLDMEDVSDANLAKFREFREYANKKGVELGGYSLLASRSVDKANDVVNPKPIFGASPCLESEWGRAYFAKLEKFFASTGFNLLEHDGSYPGDTCASTVHPGHRGFEDSQWMQYQRIANFYRSCRAQGIFLNVPDHYFMVGSNKTGMGYRESNWSLPRLQQHVHCRQNLFDGTWEKTPSMGWMMTPLVEYQGGGKEATIEPLREHLADYEQHLANNFGYGAQSCYRGPRIYDAPETRDMVKKWVVWFKKHRDILESDVVHVRRADGKNLDAILHVNPELPEKGLLMVYNPLDVEQEQTLEAPLYYTGLAKNAAMRHEDGKSMRVKLDDVHRVRITVKVAARSRTWFTFG